MCQKYGDLSVLPTRFFLAPLKIGEEIHVSIEDGKTLIVKLLAVGQPNAKTGARDVFFQMNGETRVISVADEKSAVEHASRKKANSANWGEIGAPMSGIVVEVRVKPGAAVKLGDPIAVLSAMKMETVISSPVSGIVKEISAGVGESLSAGDLVCVISKS